MHTLIEIDNTQVKIQTILITIRRICFCIALFKGVFEYIILINFESDYTIQQFEIKFLM